MIKIKSSQKSVTPPASEAYNEEGEEEEDEEEEEEEEEASPRPAKRRRTAPALPKSKTPGKSKGKGKAQVEMPALPDISTTFPIPVRKTRGKSKKAELPPYVPPQPVPLMDTVSLAAETLASQHREPLVSFSPFSSTRDAPIASSATVSVTTVLHAPSVSTTNELITDLSAAHADYELAREQLFHASARIAVARQSQPEMLFRGSGDLPPVLPPAAVGYTGSSVSPTLDTAEWDVFNATISGQKKVEDPLAGWMMEDPETCEQLTGHEWVARYPEEFALRYKKDHKHYLEYLQYTAQNDS
ncbi:hypothetical protein B0H14DRAFT_2583771 [Mycena olivaceomarginata]|nr:hypothetical protein B0H14DRAFT_2583771 [Mycena olivaceomarginata]